MSPSGIREISNLLTTGEIAKQDSKQGARRLALVVEYDGTNYSGFQFQLGQATIQGEIERSIERFTGESLRIRGASRTDSGAHATGQVVDFLTHSTQPVEKYPAALNYYLPEDIQVQAAKDMPLDFNSRKSATSRTYNYRIFNCSRRSPLRRHSHHWVKEELQIDSMSRAAEALVGGHDFRALSAGFPPDRSAVRIVYRWEIRKEGDTIIIESEANGFLRHQIRKANALLIQVGKGGCPESIINDILCGGQPKGTECPPLPARGLCLMEVKYPTFSSLNGEFEEHPSYRSVTEPGWPTQPIEAETNRLRVSS